MEISSNPPRVVARRRRGASHNLRKATFQVDDSVLQAIRPLVEQGEAPSANAFVEDALRLKLREVRRARLYAAYEQASHDPEFLADMESHYACIPRHRRRWTCRRRRVDGGQMAYLGKVRQWHVLRADLEFVTGSEQGGSSRPVIVVSNDGFNERFAVVTVVPLTKLEGKERKLYPFEYLLPLGRVGPGMTSGCSRRLEASWTWICAPKSRPGFSSILPLSSMPTTTRRTAL